MKINPASILIFALLVSACSSSGSNTEKNSSPATTSPNEPAAPESAATPSVDTNAPAIAVIENESIRFKLHSLNEITPDPAAPGKPEAGKKYYAADISIEYLITHNVTPAEYLLSAYIIDNKGTKHSLAIESVKIATLVSSAIVDKNHTEGQSFNQSNPSAGAKFRGTQYGIVLNEDAKPVKWSINLNGKDVTTDIR